MARPTKQNVEYFPHYANARNGKTLKIIQRMFGNDGYAAFFKILEILGETKGHYYQYKEFDDWLFLVSELGVEEDLAEKILEILAKTGAIDKDLNSQKVIWSDNFVEGLIPVYSKRKKLLPQKPSFRHGNLISVTETPQRKEKERKEENSKEYILSENSDHTQEQNNGDVKRGEYINMDLVRPGNCANSERCQDKHGSQGLRPDSVHNREAGTGHGEDRGATQSAREITTQEQNNGLGNDKHTGSDTPLNFMPGSNGVPHEAIGRDGRLEARSVPVESESGQHNGGITQGQPNEELDQSETGAMGFEQEGDDGRASEIHISGERYPHKCNSTSEQRNKQGYRRSNGRGRELIPEGNEAHHGNACGQQGEGDLEPGAREFAFESEGAIAAGGGAGAKQGDNMENFGQSISEGDARSDSRGERKPGGQINDNLETPTSDPVKPAAKKTTRKKTTLDLSSASQLIPVSLLEEYVEYRRLEKNKPVKTQRTLNQAVATFAKSAEICAIPIEWVVRYTMDREWLIARPEWVMNSIADIRLSYEVKGKPRQNLVECKDCRGFKTCANKGDGHIECPLFTSKMEIRQQQIQEVRA